MTPGVLRGARGPAGLGELWRAHGTLRWDRLEPQAAAGRTVRRWPEQHHYFGGVSAIGRRGAAADPRRSGCALAARPGA